MTELLLTGALVNAALAGYAVGAGEPLLHLVPIVVVEAVVVWLVASGIDLDAELEPRSERDYSAELLREVLDEYGPGEVHADCDCVGCVATRHLEHLERATAFGLVPPTGL